MKEPAEKVSLELRRIRLTRLGMIALVVLGMALAIGQIIEADNIYWAIALMASGGMFVAVYALDRNHWWALIPAYALVVTGIYIAMGGGTYSYDGYSYDNWAGFWALAAGIPFLAIFVTGPRRRWWAMIPAYFWLVVGVATMIDLSFFWTPAYLTLVTALPFFGVYAINRERMWLLVAGGVLIALSAGYVAAAADVPVLAIAPVVGIFFLARMISRQQEHPTKQPPMPKRGPEADKPPAEFEPLGAPSARSGGDR